MAHQKKYSNKSRGRWVRIPAEHFGNSVAFYAKNFLIVEDFKKPRTTKFNVLDLKKSSHYIIDIKCTKCRKKITKRIASLKASTMCFACGQALAGIRKSLKSLRRIELENNITFLNPTNVKRVTRFRKNACKCVRSQIPDNIDQQGVLRCKHDNYTRWQYFEDIIREELEGVKKTVTVDNKKRRLDCLTDKYLIEIKLNLSILNNPVQLKRFEENHQIYYPNWASKNEREYYVIFKEPQSKINGLGTNILGYEKWSEIGISNEFVEHCKTDFEKSYLTARGTSTLQKKEIIDKYLNLYIKLGGHLDNGQCIKHFKMTSRAIRLFLGGGKYLSDRAMDKIYIPASKRKNGLNVNDQKLKDKFFQYCNKNKIIPSNPDFYKKNLSCTVDKIKRIYTGKYNCSYQELQNEVNSQHTTDFKLTSELPRHKRPKTPFVKGVNKRRDIAAQKFIKYSKKIGFILPNEYSKKLTGYPTAIIGKHLLGKKSNMSELSNYLKLPNLGKSGSLSYVYEYKGSEYTVDALSTFLGFSDSKQINTIFNRQKINPVIIENNKKNKKLAKHFGTEKRLLIYRLETIRERLDKLK